MTGTQTYLRNRISQLRQNDPKGYSYRKLSRMCGFKSPNFVKLVIDGARGVSPTALQQIMSGLGFTESERQALTEVYMADATLKVRSSSNEEAA